MTESPSFCVKIAAILSTTGAESSSFSGLAKDYTNSQVELGHPENLNNQSNSVSSSSLHYSNSFYGGKLKKNFNLGKKIEDWWNTVRSSFTVVVEDLVKEGREEGGAESAPGVEGVAVEGNEWCHWKEGQKLCGGSHQGQSGWSKTTGAMDL
ncbi:hypothetical protein BY996DRAFT_6609395 [Phakopsora pachyrhizi]|uniref:Uncharacterized protein n=1 Tax=Phakopsora pachyrhizi TaxID=170000 RepID=A0AAV0B0L6_PHAPC|nr:hypothetical protein BY996DRAFT_6609395 [Phakopsora pachyrhizi]CAH7675545.1 hypothetical protein PPACK8108_LOCUS10562 [Phakopsora pachyrhizi]